ncbi:MAG: hypothetical protein ACLT98_09085 [Eggerthellaceae bacterium]
MQKVAFGLAAVGVTFFIAVNGGDRPDRALWRCRFPHRRGEEGRILPYPMALGR